MSGAKRKVALLIDADNVPTKHLQEILRILEGAGDVFVRRAYGNWQKPSLKPWVTEAPRHGVSLMQQTDPTPHKNATDISLAIDAMELLHKGQAVMFGIASSDSDFAPLAIKLREGGAEVRGFGRESTPVAFRKACTFHVLDSKPNATASKPPAAQADIDAMRAILQKALHEAIDGEGWMTLSGLGHVASKLGFNLKKTGRGSLTKFVQSLDGTFELKPKQSPTHVRLHPVARSAGNA